MHHRALGPKRANVVDAHFDELLHDQLGASPLDQGEPDRETRGGGRDRYEVAHRFDHAPEPAWPPSPSTIADRQRVTIAQPEDAGEVVPIVGGQGRVLDVPDEHMGSVLSVGGVAHRTDRLTRTPI
jgi:hypothetical protein